MALRQTTAFVESVPHLIGLDWDVPDFSTLSRPLPGKPWKADSAGALGIVLGPMADNASPRKEALRASKYLGGALWQRWRGYHRRSRVETKMQCVKLLRQRLVARDFDRQVAG